MSAVESTECMILLPQCSYCHKDDCIDDAVQDKTFCLSETENGIELKKSHAYHYQVIITLNYVLIH